MTTPFIPLNAHLSHDAPASLYNLQSCTDRVVWKLKELGYSDKIINSAAPTIAGEIIAATLTNPGNMIEIIEHHITSDEPETIFNTAVTYINTHSGPTGIVAQEEDDSETHYTSAADMPVDPCAPPSIGSTTLLGSEIDSDAIGF